MKFKNPDCLWMVLFMLAFFIPAQADTESVKGRISIRSDETLFTTFAFITIGSFETADKEKMVPIKEFVWRRLNRTLEPGYLEKIRRQCQEFQKDKMFEYRATMLALNSSPPPQIRFLKEELKRYVKGRGGNVKETLSTFRGLELLPEMLTEFYLRANIRELYEDCQPWYEEAVFEYQRIVSRLLAAAFEYLKINEESVEFEFDCVVIIPNLIGPRGSAMGPVWRGIKYDVHTPWDRISWSPHELIHDMIAPLTKSDKHIDLILSITNSIWANIEKTPARDYYQDPISFFDECLVRTIDHLVAEGRDKAGNRDRLRAALSEQANRGFVLCPLMLEVLLDYERSGQSFRDFFPEFLLLLKKKLSGQEAMAMVDCKRGSRMW